MPRTVPIHKKRIVKVYNLETTITNEDFYVKKKKKRFIKKNLFKKKKKKDFICQIWNDRKSFN